MLRRGRIGPPLPPKTRRGFGLRAFSSCQSTPGRAGARDRPVPGGNSTASRKRSQGAAVACSRASRWLTRRSRRAWAPSFISSMKRMNIISPSEK